VKIIYFLLAGVVLCIAHPAFAQRSQIKSPQSIPEDITPMVSDNQCGDFTGHFGPFDYRSIYPEEKRTVEKYHFDNEYAAFVKGHQTADTIGSSGLPVGAGFNYVLKAMPNHPTALYAVERLGYRLKTEKPPGTQYPLECWYIRAFKIAPDDPIIRVLYGFYLADRGRSSEAVHNLEIADNELLADANMQYNMGLFYFKLGKYTKSQICAMRASSLGFHLTGLEKMLKNANRWDSALKLPVPNDVGTDPQTDEKSEGETKKP